MGNSKEGTNWFKVIIQTVITVAITLTFGTLTSFLAIEKANIYIHDSVAIQSHLYVTSINISNFDTKRSLTNIKLFALNEMVFDHYQSSAAISVNNLENVLEIGNVPPNSSNSIIIYTNIPIINDTVRLSLDDKATLRFSNEEKPTPRTIINSLLSSGIAQSICLLIMFYIQDKMFKERENKRIIMNDELSKRVDDLYKKAERNEKIVEKFKLDAHKLRLYYLARIDDYKKELDFWKDTIRKVLYQSGSSKIEAENIFYIVTSNLKTFGVKTKDDSFEGIVYLAEKITEQRECLLKIKYYQTI